MHFAIRVKLVAFGYRSGHLVFLSEKEAGANQSFLPYTYMQETDSLDSIVKKHVYLFFSQTDLHWEQVHIDAEVIEAHKGSVLNIAVFVVLDITTYTRLQHQGDVTHHWQAVPPGLEKKSFNDLSSIDADIVEQAFRQLQDRTRYLPLGFYLLGNSFTYSQLQKLFEHVLGEEYDRPNFRRKMGATGLIEPIEVVEKNVRHRPAQLYRFNQEKYELIKKKGFEFKF